MKLKTSELTGLALDYAVAIAQRWEIVIITEYSPSTDWEQCGQLIEKYIDDLTHMAFRGDHWVANCRAVLVDDFSIFKTQTGDTPQIAICRAVVAAQSGDEVDIPDELLEGV
ncbi:conserved protein of unknown function [Xenorhabdus poinarii G6]|uniref:Phage ABA sandwich domain-containing protein n=1 Tax=Xenorhabdus poinarii G6 TaxID=1354304 RepID=A0A068R1V3_9GAMM|nr:phage protein NinX family protein [Xenorhabdus poinarii]CDG21039.1 conserved protein of unknown function [Xenorhabdus poinarii G6]